MTGPADSPDNHRDSLADCGDGACAAPGGRPAQASSGMAETGGAGAGAVPPPGAHLIYFADPMCSWCYGFSPVIAAILGQFGTSLPIRVVMGGLRPGTTEPMKPHHRTQLLEHWQHVQEATGLPFDPSVLSREGFLYDTDPAARAVVLARRRGMGHAIALLARLQRAFYAEARDITQNHELAAIAGEFGFDPAAFEESLASEELARETWGDYALSQNTGVRGFPTLIIGQGSSGEYRLVAKGWDSAERIVPALARFLSPPLAGPEAA